MKVIVTGAGALLGQGVIRAIRQSSLDCHVTGVDPSANSAGLYWCDNAYRGLPAGDPDFLDMLTRIIRADNADILIPGTDVELVPLARARAKLEADTGCAILVSDERVVHIGDDKAATSDFFRDAGFPFPMTAALDDGDAVGALVQALGFPLIVKPRVGARSVGVRVIRETADLDAARRVPEGLIAQELVGDAAHEYTASGLYFDGDCHGTIVMRRDLRDGNTYRAEVVADADLHDWVRRWTRALTPYGPANFQFRLRADGTPVVFEINSRFSGTTPLRALVGFNEVEMALEHILNGRPIRPGEILNRVILRHWSETVVTPEDITAVGLPE